MALCKQLDIFTEEEELTDLDDLVLGDDDRMGNADSEGGEFTDWSR